MATPDKIFAHDQMTLDRIDDKIKRETVELLFACRMCGCTLLAMNSPAGDMDDRYYTCLKCGNHGDEGSFGHWVSGTVKHT